MLIHIIAQASGMEDIVFDAKFQSTKAFYILLNLLWDKGYEVISKRIDEENTESNDK